MSPLGEIDGGGPPDCWRPSIREQEETPETNAVAHLAVQVPGVDMDMEHSTLLVLSLSASSYAAAYHRM